LANGKAIAEPVEERMFHGGSFCALEFAGSRERID
jgi:hypothetical protein